MLTNSQDSFFSGTITKQNSYCYRGFCKVFFFFFFFFRKILIIITKACPCNIQRFFSAVKIENFVGNVLIIVIIFAKT